MGSKSKGNFIMISPDAIMQDGSSSVAVFNISGINEEDTTEYYPIMSNFYNTALWFGTGTLEDTNGNKIPPQALYYNMVNKINYNGDIYWLSKSNDTSLKYCDIESSGADYITISTTDNWNTYTVVSGGGMQ